MNVEILIFRIGILIGLLLFGITKQKFVKGILIGLIISYALSFFKIQLLTTVGHISFIILCLVYSIHSVINKNWRNLIIGFFAFASLLFGILHWNYGGEVQLSMLIPIVAYLSLFTKWRKYKSEISVLTIFVAYEISQFVVVTQQWIN